MDDTVWTLISFEPKTVAPAPKPVPLSVCPKCSKKLGKGGHFHVKHCKAATDGKS